MNFINFYQKISKKIQKKGTKDQKLVSPFWKLLGWKILSSPQKPQISKVSSNKNFPSNFFKLIAKYFRQKIKGEKAFFNKLKFSLHFLSLMMRTKEIFWIFGEKCFIFGNWYSWCSIISEFPLELSLAFSLSYRKKFKLKIKLIAFIITVLISREKSCRKARFESFEWRILFFNLF